MQIQTVLIKPAVARLRVAIFTELLKAREEKQLLDLGAGPCTFAMHARDLGFDVTAVDARTERVPSAEKLGSVRFVQSDIRSYDLSGSPLISILGLFYHLTLDDQIELLSRCTHATVILETQVHDPSYIPPLARPWAEQLQELDGYQGVLFRENDNPMASVGNAASFWHTLPSLLHLAESSGFREARVIEPRYTTKYGMRRFLTFN